MSAPQLLNRLRLRQVALLLDLQAGGTLHAAAARLGMTQPAASKMLHELEGALGCTLFERRNRGLRLTPAGQTVLDHFHGLRGSIEALSRDLKSLREGGVGRLSIGNILAASPALLTHVVAQMKREQPLLSISITSDTSDHLLELLDQGTLDVVLGRLVEGFSHTDYLCKVLESEPLTVVVGPQHPLARKRRVKLAELDAQPWILQPRGSPMRELLEQEFRAAGLDRPRDLVETASIPSITSLIAETPMIAVLPASVAAWYARHHMLAILPLRLRLELPPYSSIVRRGRPLTAAANRFLHLLHGRPRERPRE
ncbi:MAG TPA: LysR family transcriptional regulator [Burkholderiaceae bacterium]|nr:LysR family transcriptional regulator [Burkholderiaceae bacterium]